MQCICLKSGAWDKPIWSKGSNILRIPEPETTIEQYLCELSQINMELVFN